MRIQNCKICASVLLGIRGVNDDSVLRLVVDNEVRIVVTAPHPLIFEVKISINCPKKGRQAINLHIGIDWTCMARVKASYMINPLVPCTLTGWCFLFFCHTIRHRNMILQLLYRCRVSQKA